MFRALENSHRKMRYYNMFLCSSIFAMTEQKINKKTRQTDMCCQEGRQLYATLKI